LLRGPCLCPRYEQGKNAVAILGLDAIRLSNWDRQSPVKNASDSLATMEARLLAISNGKQDFVYLPEEDAYRCPAGEQLPYRFTSEEDGKLIRRYWTTACQKLFDQTPMHDGT
jgi:hypothetical protein